MRKITRIILAGFGLGLVTFVFAFFSSRPTPGQLPPPLPPVVPVKVTNTPLLVQGNVSASISNTPLPTTVTNIVPVSGSVQITNASIPVTGSLSGFISNPANNPALVSSVNDSVDREFSGSLCEADYSFPAVCSGTVITDATGNQEFVNFFTIPTSTPKGLPVTRAVIEYVDGRCRADTNDDIVEVGIQGLNNNAASWFAPVKTPGAARAGVPVPGQTNPTTWSFSHTTKIYLSPGASMFLFVRSTNEQNNLQECSSNLWGTLLTQ